MDQETEIPKWYQPALTKNIEPLLRKGASLLRGTFMEGTYKGQSAEVVKQYGKAAARVGNEDRNGDTPIMTTPRDSRWAYPTVIDIGDLFEKLDELKMIVEDPTNPVTTGFAGSMGEALDDLMIGSLYGIAKTGVNGATNTAYDTSRDVAETVGSMDEATNTGMNVEKLLTARANLKKNYVHFGREPIYVGLSAQEEKDLFRDPLYTNSQYGQVVLDSGNMKNYLGFTFVELEEWPTNVGGTIRYNPVWAKSGMHLGVWENLRVEIGKDPGKKFNIRVYMQQYFGPTRLQEKKVLRILNKI